MTLAAAKLTELACSILLSIQVLTRPLSLKLSDPKVYEPQIRARLGTTAHFCEVVVLKLKRQLETLMTIAAAKLTELIDLGACARVCVCVCVCVYPRFIQQTDVFQVETLMTLAAAKLTELAARKGFLDHHGIRVRRNLKRFRGGLVSKAHRLVYHPTLGLIVIKKKKKKDPGTPSLHAAGYEGILCQKLSNRPYG